jgi:hypothetical protein
VFEAIAIGKFSLKLQGRQMMALTVGDLQELKLEIRTKY